jgi:hypothetical protein
MCTRLARCLTLTACVLACGPAARADIIGVGLGWTLPRPTTLGPYDMTPFPDDPQPFDWVTSVASPLGGELTFSVPLLHTHWVLPYWGAEPDPDLYISIAQPVTIQLPEGTRAVSLYVGTETGASQWVSVTADGQTTITQYTGSYMTPCYFGFYVDDPAETISTLEVPFPGFAGDVGAFAIAVPEPASACLLTLGLGVLMRRR